MLYFTHLSRKKLPVTDLTNRDGPDFACDGHDFLHIKVRCVTQNCDGPDRDGPDDTVSFSIITLNVDESWCPFWCIWTHKHIILQLPWLLTIIQLLQLVSSADWSKVHHVTQGIFCNDRWWRFAGHYSIEPTGHYLRARVLWILYCKLGLRVQNPHPHS